MVETAQFLLNKLSQNSSKKVILTGSIHPLELPYSDAPFNIGFACNAVMNSSPGVWIAFNGELWHPKGLKKNVTESRFELTHSNDPQFESPTPTPKKEGLEHL